MVMVMAALLCVTWVAAALTLHVFVTVISASTTCSHRLFSHRLIAAATGPFSHFFGDRPIIRHVVLWSTYIPHPDRCAGCCLLHGLDGRTMDAHIAGLQDQLDPAREMKARVGGALHTTRIIIGYAGKNYAMAVSAWSVLTTWVNVVMLLFSVSLTLALYPHYPPLLFTRPLL